jgi:hypothetical protein
MELAWREIDHELVRHKLSLISQEMQPKVLSETTRVLFEGRKSGNSGFIKSGLVDIHVTLTDEWLDRVYRAYCEVWSLQDKSKSAGFVRAVFEKALVPLISTRQGIILDQFKRMGRHARNHSFSPPNDALVRALGHLRGKWRDRLEIEARSCKYGTQRGVAAEKQTVPSQGPPKNQEDQGTTTKVVPADSVLEDPARALQMSKGPKDYTSVWDQIDTLLISLKLQEPLNQHIEDVDKERRTIEHDNRDNRQASVRAILQMVERRADEWIRVRYDAYCEVWELQGRAKSADFLRTLRDNIIEPAVRARTTAETYHLVSKWERCGYPVQPGLQAQLASFRHSMQKLEVRWKTRLEIEARECDYKTRRKVVTGESAQTHTSNSEQAQQQSPPTGPANELTRRRRKPKMKSTAEKVREARICAAIAQGNKGLAYCRDVKAQRVVTRVTWQSDGCPRDYPDAYTHPNPRWRELIQKEKNRYARKMKKA